MRWKLCVLLISAGFGWWLNPDVPEGFSKPWSLRTRMAVDNVANSIMNVLDILRVCTIEEAMSKFLILSLNQKTVTFQDNISVRDEYFDGVQVRVYQPKAKSTSGRPGMVFYHGGGWMFLNTAFYDPLMYSILEELDIVIVSVEYRLAPDHKFPVPFEDCRVATKYFLNNLKEYGVDESRVAIAGDSAGGNLAAAVVLKLRDEGFSPRPKQQLLIYPVLQAVDLTLPSYQQNADSFLTKRFLVSRAISLYAKGSLKYSQYMDSNLHVSAKAKEEIFKSKIHHGDLPQELLYAPYTQPDMTQGLPEVWEELKDIIGSPYFSPLLAEDLSGLPDTYVFTSHYDVLRDEGFLYVKRLREAGVAVTHVNGVNNVHGSCNLKEEYPVEADECISNFTKFLKTL